MRDDEEERFYLVSKPLWHFFVGCFGGGPAICNLKYLKDRTPISPQPSIKNYNTNQREENDDIIS